MLKVWNGEIYESLKLTIPLEMLKVTKNDLLDTDSWFGCNSWFGFKSWFRLKTFSTVSLKNLYYRESKVKISIIFFA